MTIRTRFVLTAVFNCLIMLGLLYFFSRTDVDLSQRLIDFDLSDPRNFSVFLVLIGGLLAALLVNFFIQTSRKNEVGYEELAKIANALRH